MGEIIMPKMGDAMTEGKVVRWYKKAGDALKSGEAVLEIETDKVNLDLEAEEDGVLDEVLVREGDTAEVGQKLALVRGKGEPKRAKAAAEKASGQEQEEPESPISKKGPAGKEVAKKDRAVAGEQPRADDDGGRARSSPLARKLAGKLGVDLASLTGSGPSGRIIAEDVKEAAAGRPSPAPESVARPVAPARQPSYRPPTKTERKEIPLTAMRRTIAKRLAESTGPIPHFYLTIDCDVTTLQSLRRQFNEIEGMKVSVNDFVIRATALSLLHHPNVNASFQGESILQHGEVHIGIAVATEEGLVTPVIRDADGKSVPRIAGEVRDLAERARGRKLRPDEYQGGTFTISNLGMYGIEEFTAIINPPNAAILAVGAAIEKPVVIDGRVEVRDRMKVTMSCDHRVVDGAAGAEFLRTFQQYVEQPLRLII